MTELFLELVKMSLIGALFAAMVMAVRLVFRKAPKWIFVVLWGVVALRLILPFSVESKVSLVPDSLASGEVITNVSDAYVGPVDIVYEQDPAYRDALEAGGRPVHSDQGDYIVTQKDSVETPKTFGQTVLPILSWVWLAGVALMLAYTAASYILLKRKMAVATLLAENIWQCEKADMPFVLGVFRPKIYLPYGIAGEDVDYVIAHEQAHIARRDHWWKPLGFFLLSVHWFNPVLWVAYILLCRDIEAACDEKVIGPMEKEAVRAYSTALLNCSVHRRRIAACPLAFGETGVKERIRRVMNYKKPTFWIILIAIIIAVVMIICFCTDPLKKAENPDPSENSATEQTENKENTITQTDYPKINEIEYYFVDGTSDGQPAVLMGFKNNSKYTVVSVRLYFKMKADATQQELSVFDDFVESGDLTPEELSKLGPSFFNEMVCDPGETVEGSPCTLFHHQYATDVKQCQLLGLRQAHISFQGDNGRVYTVVYTADNNGYELQKEARPAKVWTDKAFTKVTPVPNTRFITVNRDNSDRYQFTAYDMTLEQYRAYCSECKTAGFTKDIVENDRNFSAISDSGLALEVLYHPSMRAVVVVAFNSNTDENNGNNGNVTTTPKPTVDEIIGWHKPVLSGPVRQYVQADSSRSAVYRMQYHQDDTVIPVWLPILIPFSEDAAACQADIEKDLERDLNSVKQAAAGLYKSSIVCIEFDAYLSGDILSVVIKTEISWGQNLYYTYNFDVTTGKRLTKEALIEKLQITNFVVRLTQTAKNGFETKYGPVGGTDGFKAQQLDATIAPANLESAQLYVGQDGKLMTVIYVHAIAGAAGYYELVPFSYGQTENTEATQPEITEVYFSKEDFQSLVVGKSLARDVLDAIAPKPMPALHEASYGLYCDFPLKEGGYIRVAFYNKDGFPILVGSIDEVPSGAVYVHKGSTETIGFTNLTGKNCIIKVERARILPFSDDAIACQKELAATYQTILAEIQERVAQSNDAITCKIGYDALLNDDILSLVIKAEYDVGDDEVFAVYNFNVATGERLDKKTL